MYRLFLIFIICLTLFGSAFGQINIVTSTTDLAWFAEVIGKDKVSVTSIAGPESDIHFIEIRPSYMRKVARADIVLKVGLELDMWVDRIIDGSRNSDLIIIDCSKYIEPLEVPTFEPDARHGDLHRYGNPHYWMGPGNVEPIMRAIVEGLSEADPENAAFYEKNKDEYLNSFKSELAEIKDGAKSLEGKEAIFYHNSWPYFNRFVGLEAAEFIEPYPGVPPSPSHVRDLVRLVESKDIKAIAVEPYFDKRVPEKIAAETGAKVITLYPSIGGRVDNETYTEWLRGNINALAGAIK